MSKAPKIPLPAAMRRRLQETATPGWLIDAAGARVLWANGPGRRAWGFTAAGESDGWLLDRAMPALAQLMAMDRPSFKGDRDPMAGEVAQLAFWTPKGILRQDFWCRQIPDADPGLMLVTVAGDDGPVEGAGRSPEPECAAPSPACERARRPVIAVADDGAGADGGTVASVMESGIEPGPADADLAVLQDIARQIRGDGTAAVVEALPSDADLRGNHGDTCANGSALQQPNVTGGRSSMVPQIVMAPEPGGGRVGEPLPGESSIDAAQDILKKTAHELRTPVSAIHTLAEIMFDERFGPIGGARYKGYAKDLLNSAAHALNVIDAMLAPIDQAAEGARPAPAELDLDALAGSVVSAVRPLAEKAGVRIGFEPAPRLPFVAADATAVRQIILNLVTNAIKFTGDRGHIAVTTALLPDGRPRVEVRDTGTGMSAAKIADIMNAAADRSAAARSRTGPRGGLGLGLPLSRALARDNGAELALSSQPGEGTTAAVIFAIERVRSQERPKD